MLVPVPVILPVVLAAARTRVPSSRAAVMAAVFPSGTAAALTVASTLTSRPLLSTLCGRTKTFSR